MPASKYKKSTRHIPIKCATKSARPMASGAMKVVRLFSTASMMIVKMSSAVSIASRKSPCITVASEEREFSAWRGPGSKPETRPAATIAPRNCIGITQTNRTQSNAPAIHNARDT